MNALYAEMSEWFKEHDWKSCDAGTYPEVQILFSAPVFSRSVAIWLHFFSLLFRGKKSLVPPSRTPIFYVKTAFSERSDCNLPPYGRNYLFYQPFLQLFRNSRTGSDSRSKIKHSSGTPCRRSPQSTLAYACARVYYLYIYL